MLSVSIFNVARYLTDSLQGPVLADYSEADRPSLMGWMGWDGMDGMGWVILYTVTPRASLKSDAKNTLISTLIL